MNILVVGREIDFEECQQKFGARQSVQHADSRVGATDLANDSDLIFDFLVIHDPDGIAEYRDAQCPVFVNTAAHSLKWITKDLFDCQTLFFGFNGLPPFFSAPMLELSVKSKDDEQRLSEICELLDAPFQIVQDQPGMVTPQIISMIVNEAYHAVGEGIASREDVDLAMRLGTNYPYGPFEWAQKIGLQNILLVLRALKAETGQERYFISPFFEEECKRSER